MFFLFLAPVESSTNLISNLYMTKDENLEEIFNSNSIRFGKLLPPGHGLALQRYYENIFNYIS